MVMKPYDCDYTWTDVKDATNRCLILTIEQPIEDPVKMIYQNALPNAMISVGTYCFIKGTLDFHPDDVKLIRDAFIQLGEVGYIGQG